jgi:MFS family permease
VLSHAFRLPVFTRRRAHHLLAFGIYLVLGCHVGVWAVELPRLAHALELAPAALGGAVSVSAAAGIVSLFGGGVLADRLGRRSLLLIGFGGTALAFTALAAVRSFGQLLPVFVLYGLTVSFVDLGASTVGSDFEHVYGVRVMTGLQAGFSLGAIIGASVAALLLSVGCEFRVVYLVLAVLLSVSGLVVTRASLPQRADETSTSPASSPGTVWRLPGVRLAIAIVTATFFGDGTLESFVGVYLSHWRSAGGLLIGAGIGGYHVAMFAGRLLASRALRSWSERRTLLCGGALAALGFLAMVGTTLPQVTLAGLLLVGFAEAPIVPTALSIAGRAAPGRSGQAVASTTAAGYSAFIVGPVVIGGVSAVVGLRGALSLLVCTVLSVCWFAGRLPER